MSNEMNATQTKIASLIDTRVNTLLASSDDKTLLASKFTALRASLVANATFFSKHHVNVEFISTIAIYALQKVERIARSVVTNVNDIDDYTAHLIRNARALDNTLSNEECNASLCSTIAQKSERALASRKRSSSANTATTQASSSRQALAALHAAKIDKHSVTMLVESKTHKAICALLDA